MVVLTRRATVAQLVDRLLLALLVVDPGLLAADSDQLASALQGYLSVRLSSSVLQESLDRLESHGRLTRGPSGRSELTEATRDEITARVSESVALERVVRDEWISSLSATLQTPVAAEELWRCLQLFASTAFLKHGAEAVLMLNPDVPLERALERSVAGLLDDAAKASCVQVPRDVVRAEVRRFFESPPPARARYIAQLLDGAFAIFALSVDDDTANYLRSQLSHVDLFLDTNFIFGILGLNTRHPEVEFGQELLALIARERFPFTLYYHEETMREIERTLDSIEQRLTRNRWQAAMSRAAVRTNLLSGVEQSYHELNAERPTDPEAFMSRYRHMDVLLSDRGFKIYRSSGNFQEDVAKRGELVARYQEYLAERTPGRPKAYVVMNHDVAVWLAVQKRRRNAKNVLQTRALFLTMDYRFFRFAWERLRTRGESGSVVLPRQLLQVIRPFAESDEEFDRRFVEAFVIPEIRSLGAIPADTASKVLSYLNAFKDLPEDTAVRILTNEVLARRLADVDESSPSFAAAIDNALADDNRSLLEERDALNREVESMRLRLTEEITTRAAAERGLAETRGEAAAQELHQHELAGHEVHQLEEQLSRSRTRESRWRTLVAIGLGVFGVLVVTVVGAILYAAGPAEARADLLRLAGAASVGWLAVIWAVFDPAHRPWSIGVILCEVVVLTVIEVLPVARFYISGG